MDIADWVSDPDRYARMFQFSAKAGSRSLIAWIGVKLAGMGPWRCATRAQDDDTMVEASLSGRPAFQLLVSPLGEGIVEVQGDFTGEDMGAFNDYVVLYEEAVALFGWRVVQAPQWALPPEQGTPEPAASRKGGRPRKTELTADERRAAECYQEAVAKGTPKRVAARLQGHDYKTLERWRRLLGE